jgi:hypothetical protein
MKGVSNGRRSPSSPPHLANGMPSSKSNGSWMNPGMGMGSFQVGSSNGKGGDRDARTVHDDDERDRLVTRDRDRKRAERDNMERRDYWEKEYPDSDRDRTRDLPYIHQPSSLQYGHGSGAPTPGPGVDGHHHSSHQHRNHHHHVLHRHGPPHPPSSLPSPMHPGSGGAPPIVHSPRSTRDYDMPGSSSVPHPTTDASCSPQVEASPSPRHERGNISGPKEIWIPRSTIHRPCTITATVKRTCESHTHIDPLPGRDPSTIAVIVRLRVPLSWLRLPQYRLQCRPHLISMVLVLIRPIKARQYGLKIIPIGCHILVDLTKPIDLPFKHIGIHPGLLQVVDYNRRTI